MGTGRCNVCHFGPAFTNGEFHDVGVPYALGPDRVDAGRSEGMKRVRADRFNLLGPWSDDRTGTAAAKTRHVEGTPASFDQFKTPSLRNLGHTAPYMTTGVTARCERWSGSIPICTWNASTRTASSFSARSSSRRRRADDLVAFLESLTDPGAVRVPIAPVVDGWPPR